jgi:DMSO reductase anchor subunit
VFTVGLQLAAGIELSMALLLWGAGVIRVPRCFAISVFPITASAIAVSLLHLGKPGAAWRAFTNVLHSKLSREIVTCSVFCCLALTQFIACLLRGIVSPALTLAIAGVGIAAVVASARIYTLPAQPLWNSGWVTASFIGSTLLLGGVVTTIADGGSLSSLMIATGAVVLLASCARMITEILRIHKRRYASPESPTILQTKHWLSVFGLIVGTVVPILGVIVDQRSGPVAIATAVIAVIGVVLGRALMYSRGIALARF